MSSALGGQRTEVERSAHRIVVEEVGGRRLRRFVVDCPRGRSRDLSDCGRCPDCRGYTLRSLVGSTVVCSLAAGETPRGPAPDTVAAAMCRDLTCVAPNLPIGSALDLLVEQRLRGVSVIDDADRPIGSLTAAKVIELSRKPGHPAFSSADAAAIARALDASQVPVDVKRIPVRDAMTHPAHTVHELDPLDAARQRMRAQHLARLMVVDDEGRTIGALNATDAL